MEDQDRDDQEHQYKWDIFECYNEDNFHEASIIFRQLTDGYHGKQWTVATHERDFTAGVPIHENMKNCIRDSKRTILLLSTPFLWSTYCQQEFKFASALPER